MTEMVDRIALALAKTDEHCMSSKSNDDPMILCSDPTYCWCRQRARIAIASMREPTEAMIEAGKYVAISVLAQTIKPEQVRSLVYTGVQEWRAMIGAALGEKP